MPIKPRPDARLSPKGVDAAESFISKGGSVGQPLPTVEPPTQEDEIQSLRLRVPTPLLERIDAQVKGRQLKTSRHHWILEALLFYLEHEESELS